MPDDLNEKKPTAVSEADAAINVSFFSIHKKKGGPITPISCRQFFMDSELYGWSHMKHKLRDKGVIRLTYLDAEGDEIPIESACEFEEFQKYCEENSNSEVLVKFLAVPEDCDSKTSSAIFNEDHSASPQIINLVETAQKQTKMAPKELEIVPLEKSKPSSQLNYNQIQQQMALSVSDATEFGKNKSQLRHNEIQPENSEDSAPKWFTNYMQTMKEEIVTEISQKVTTIVMNALSKKRESHYDSASSNPHVSDSEYLLDSDFEEKVSLVDQTSSYFQKNREKKLSDLCTRSVNGHRYENTRRNYRHTQEKQRNKRGKNHSINHAISNPEEIWHSPSLNRRRGEKIARNKREFDEARALSLNSTRSELISLDKNLFNEEFLGEQLNSSCQKKNSSEMKRSSSSPASSANILETPTLKLRLANPYKKLPDETEEKIRMGCSVTGQDLLEKPNERNPEYFVLSDSDNISIISDISHNSEKLRSSNDFEMVLKAPPIFTDDIEDDLAPKITTDFSSLPQQIEDADNARDSSSFELLSEPPPSPPLSIHMDEDHFATAINETNDYNINDKTTIDKRGNQSKIGKSNYVIDAHGKIYQQNITEGAEESPEIVLEKRSGGVYSFVGESLPATTKEAAVSDKSDSADPSAFNLADDDENHVTEEPERFVYHAFYDSTQSFHSHTAQQAEKNRNDFTAASAASKSEETNRGNIFVDHNASKGLGDTKRSAPKKQTFADDKNSEDSNRSRNRSNRRFSYDSQGFANKNKSSRHDLHGSANRKENSRHDPRSRRFGNWTTSRTRMMDDLVTNAVDPMHILPETIVTGAVDVASRAYTTARRVYDKILTAQMRKPADRSQSKFGRR